MQTIQTRMTREQLIDHCADILRKKGRWVQKGVFCGVGNSLKADLVTVTTVYEFRQFLPEIKLYEGKGQGLTYAGLLGKRRVVVVGYLPEAAGERSRALTIAENIEKAGYVKISFIDLDPFWELVPISHRPLWYVALLVGIVALAVFAIPLVREEVGCRVRPELEACAVDRVYRP